MRVLMFGWEFPPHISGGLGTACFGITRGLSTISDIEILFVVPKAYGDENQPKIKLLAAGDTDLSKHPDLLKLLEKSGKYVEVASRLIPYIDPEYYEIQANTAENQPFTLAKIDSDGKLQFTGSYGSSLLSEISGYAVTAEIIAKEHDFDIIHAHDWLTYPAGIAAKKASGKPLITHVHATDFDRSGGSANPRVYEIEREGMEMADRVITVSNLTRDAVINRYHIDAKKVVTIYNAVEPVHVPHAQVHVPDVKGNVPCVQGFVPDIHGNVPGLPLNDKRSTLKTVTFLGRITKQKGPEYFVKAAALVLKKMKDVRFVMAGSGDMMNEMILMVSRLGISHRFHFPGFLKGDEVRQMLQCSDVFVMPSVSEPFGITPLEALQAGVPSIISKQSGVSEVLSNVIKVDFWDIDATADAIYGLLRYKGLAKMLSEQGKIEVDGLKWEHSAQQIYSVYKGILAA